MRQPDVTRTIVDVVCDLQNSLPKGTRITVAKMMIRQFWNIPIYELADEKHALEGDT